MISERKTLPPGWSWARLGDHTLKIGSGLTPLGGQTTYVSSGIPLIRSQNVHMNSFISDGLAFITYKQDEYMCESRVKTGDVLLNITGASIGRVCVVPDNFTPANVNQHVSIIRSDGSLDPYYLSFFLSTTDFQEYIMSTQAGATRQALTKGLIESFQIPITSLAEQRRIAGILKKQMAAVEKARKASEARIEAVKALTASFLRQVFPQPGQPLPDTWRWVKLGEVCEISSGQVDPTLKEYCDLPHVNGENIESGSGRLLEVRSAVEDNMTSGKYLFYRGAVLYSKLRPYLKKAVIVDFDGLCSADMYPISTWADRLSPRFLLKVLLSDDFTEYAVSESQRARMPKLNRDQLFAYQIPLPPLPEQERITAKLNQQMAAIEKARAAALIELEMIDALPATLLRRAFKGKL